MSNVEIAPKDQRVEYMAYVYKMSHSQLFQELMRVHAEATKLVEEASNQSRQSLTNQQVFELAEEYGWQDDFGRWNFTDEKLLSFVDQIQSAKRQWVEITKGECDELYEQEKDHVQYAWAIEAKLKEKNA